MTFPLGHPELDPDPRARVVAELGGQVGLNHGQPVVEFAKNQFGRVAKDGTIKPCPRPKS